MEILEPWQMVSLAVVDDILHYLDQMLEPQHPLREHKLFPFLQREDAPVWIVTKYNDDGHTWLLDLGSKMRVKGRTCYAFQQLEDDSELEQMIQLDHQRWLAQLDHHIDVPMATGQQGRGEGQR